MPVESATEITWVELIEKGRGSYISIVALAGF